MTLNHPINIRCLPTLWPHNVEWSAFFGNDHPVDLEIGTGRTHFFFDRQKNFPERNIVGIEWKYEFIQTARRRIARENISNALALHGNAWALVPMLFPKNSIDLVFINFPDPWWKNKHKKRLLLNNIFLDDLKEKVRPSGGIYVQTDVKELFQYYTTVLNTHGAFCLDSAHGESMICEDLKAQTHREKKCIEQGLPIYRFFFRRGS